MKLHEFLLLPIIVEIVCPAVAGPGYPVGRGAPMSDMGPLCAKIKELGPVAGGDALDSSLAWLQKQWL